MAEIRPFRESTLRQAKNLTIDSHELGSGPEGRFCAYYLTGQRFISNDVEVADASAGSFDHCLSSLTPGSGAVVWIIPIRNLSATSFRFPVDLLYLAEDGTVMEAVYSFPIGRVSSSAMAASILALPARTLLLSGIETGDKLILCSPVEMERRLVQAYAASTAAEPQPISDRAFAIDEYKKTDIEAISSFSDDTCCSSSSLERQCESFTHAESPAALSVSAPSKPEDPEIAFEPMPPPEKSEPASKKTWWQKLFPDGPEEDARQSPRQALPGMVAYFFTGGTPVPHPVRNISTSGVYIFTAERWYKGTVVRLTLTDEREPTSERSITLHGMVARSTDEGVALQFIVEAKRARSRNKASALEHLPGGSSIKQIEEFILRFKSRP